MPIYQGTAIKNVFDLINRDNPGLPFPVNESTMIVGVPLAIAPTAQKHDTQIRLVPKSGSMYRGGITLTYRRLILASLFRECTPIIERFFTSRWIPVSEMLPLVNAAAGMNFSMVDFVEGNTIHGSQIPGRNFTLTVKPESLMYTGTVTMAWVMGKEELGLDIMTQATLAGELWPSDKGNDFVAWDDRRAYGTWLFWNKHFTEEAILGNWPAVAAGTVTNTSVGSADASSYGGIGKMYADAFLAQGLEINFDPYNETTNPKGLGTKPLFLRFIGLPHPSYPEANRPGFSYAAVMYTQDAALYNKFGRTIMYYNK